jgi:hypothetical protein
MHINLMDITWVGIAAQLADRIFFIHIYTLFRAIKMNLLQAKEFVIGEKQGFIIAFLEMQCKLELKEMIYERIETQLKSFAFSLNSQWNLHNLRIRPFDKT